MNNSREIPTILAVKRGCEELCLGVTEEVHVERMSLLLMLFCFRGKHVCIHIRVEPRGDDMIFAIPSEFTDCREFFVWCL